MRRVRNTPAATICERPRPPGAELVPIWDLLFGEVGTRARARVLRLWLAAEDFDDRRRYWCRYENAVGRTWETRNRADRSADLSIHRVRWRRWREWRERKGRERAEKKGTEILLALPADLRRRREEESSDRGEA
jgi:hypothetical protein